MTHIILHTMISKTIQSLAEDVHMVLGAGHSESLYARALGVALQKKQINYEAEKVFPLMYKDEYIGFCRPDLIIDKKIVVEIKCLGQISGTQRLQLLRYMRLPCITEGILINFGPQQVDFFCCHAA